jgi:hypothetical protein
MTVYVLIWLANAAIIGVKVSAVEPEIGLTSQAYLLYECVLDSSDQPTLIARNG